MSRSILFLRRAPLALAIAAACAQTAMAETVKGSGGSSSAATPAEQTLPDIVVTAMSASDGFITQSDAASVGKSNVSVQDTPFAMNVVDVAQARESGAKNVQEALAYTAGVYTGRYGFDTRGDWAAIRGLGPATYLDGLRGIYGFYNNVRPEIYTLERIEVLKGPSSVLYGQAELGGIINAVSKLPKAVASREIELQVGSYDRKQLGLDLTGPLNKDKTFLYRLVALKRDSETQVDFVNDDAQLFMPSLTWRPNRNTSLTAMFISQESKSKVSSQFLPFKGTLGDAPLGRIPASRFAGEPGWDRYDTRKNELTLQWDQRLSTDWRLVANLRKTNSSSVTREIYTTVGQIPDNAGNMPRTVHAADRKTDVLASDVRFEGGLRLGPTRHQVALGVDHQNAYWQEFNYFSKNTTFAADGVDNFNVYNPVYGSAGMTNFLSNLALADRPDNKIVQTGIYATDHVEWGPWVLSGAWRHDRARNETLNLAPTQDVVVTNAANTARVGLMYRFNNGISPYASWSTAFMPLLGTDGAGGFLKPMTGEQTEAGVKFLSPSGRTSAAFARFEIEQQNRVSSNNLPGGVEQVNASTKGWEAEVKHRFGAFEVLANYTALEAINPATGKRLSAIAEKTASAWGQYRFNSGWRVGLGTRYLGDLTGANGTPEVPSVTLLDAMVGYSTGAWDVRMDARNLADKTYVSWCRGTNQDCGYGERFYAGLTARYKF